MNKVEQAIALMQSSGCNAINAAKKIGIQPSAVYRAVHLREKWAKMKVCPKCNWVGYLEKKK
jgi:hypothetical protein